MLSKFAFFENAEITGLSQDWHTDFERAVREVCRPTSPIAFIDGGTLSICARFDQGGRRRFLKTHLPHAAGRMNLAKEAGLLAWLYGELIGLEQVELSVLGRSYLCMIMDVLQPLQPPLGPDQANALIAVCAERLSDYPSVGMDGFGGLLDTADIALAELANGAIIDSQLSLEISSRLALLRAQSWPSSICHGDYGPRNIMSKSGRPIIIDWEDAFVGVPNYDYLYWLTFIENRQYYPTAFSSSNYGKEITIALVIMIITVKSALSVRSGAYRRHSISIPERIGEIVQLGL